MITGAARGLEKPGREALSVKALSREYPGLKKKLAELGVPLQNADTLSLAFLCEEAGVDPQDVFEQLTGKVETEIISPAAVGSLTIIPGRNKSGKPEYPEPLVITSGEIIAVVGPTGSGKSQLLNDIEGLVQGDSPSKRRILINNEPGGDSLRIDYRLKPIAQISQNMNYLIDLTIDEFLEIRIASRGLKNGAGIKRKVVQQACTLCGEPFSPNSRLVSLSGGQARSLMIADALSLGNAPIILVDEIENAGIDRERAVDILLQGRAVSIIATHDPLIALMAHKRIVLKNGGIAQIARRTPEEEKTLDELKKINAYSNDLKNKLRSGQKLLSS